MKGTLLTILALLILPAAVAATAGAQTTENEAVTIEPSDAYGNACVASGTTLDHTKGTCDLKVAGLDLDEFSEITIEGIKDGTVTTIA